MATPDRFEGYDTTRVEATPVLALFDESRTTVAELDTGQRGYVVLERTPFYVEAGGQVSDTGRLTADGPETMSADVDGLERLAPGGPRAHRVRVRDGSEFILRQDVTTGTWRVDFFRSGEDDAS